MPQKIIQKDSPFAFLGDMLELQTKRGKVLGLKMALIALAKQELELVKEVTKLEKELADENDAQSK